MAQVYQQKNAANNSWTVRVFTGRDARGKRKYANYTVEGTKKQAEAKARELQHKHETGQAVAPQRLTLGQYLEWWNAEVAVPRLKSERTKQDYIKQMRRYVIPMIGADSDDFGRRFRLIAAADSSGLRPLGPIDSGRFFGA
jgi:hypothetical protein